MAIDPLVEVVSAERRAAARALLRHPLLLAGGPDPDAFRPRPPARWGARPDVPRSPWLAARGRPPGTLRAPPEASRRPRGRVAPGDRAGANVGLHDPPLRPVLCRLRRARLDLRDPDDPVAPRRRRHQGTLSAKIE